MRYLLLLLPFLFSFDTAEMTLPGKSEVYIVLPDNCNVKWKGTKITGSAHTGTVQLAKGQITRHRKNKITGEFVLDMTTIQNTDIKGESAESLEKHLSSPDFFDVGNYPTATLIVTKGQPKEKGSNLYEVKGKLTVRGITLPIIFPANIEFTEVNGNPVVAAEAAITLNRSKWGVSFQPGTPVDGTFEKVISEEVTITVAFVATHY